MSTATSVLISYTNPDITDDEWDDILLSELGENVTGEQLWTIAAELATRRQAIQRLERAVERLRAKDITTNGAVRFADTFVTVAPKRTRILDTEALLGWATDKGIALPSLFRLSQDNLRITTLRSAAAAVYRRNHPEATEDDAAEYAKVIESTFVTIEKGDPKLTEIPIDKAPQYAQLLEHGHRTGSFANKKTVPADD